MGRITNVKTEANTVLQLIVNMNRSMNVKRDLEQYDEVDVIFYCDNLIMSAVPFNALQNIPYDALFHCSVQAVQVQTRYTNTADAIRVYSVKLTHDTTFDAFKRQYNEYNKISRLMNLFTEDLKFSLYHYTLENGSFQ